MRIACWELGAGYVESQAITFTGSPMNSRGVETIAPTPLEYAPAISIPRPRIARCLYWNVAGSFATPLVFILARLHVFLPLMPRVILSLLEQIGRDAAQNAVGFFIALLLLRSRAIGTSKPYYIAAFLAGAGSVFSVFLRERVWMWAFLHAPRIIRYRIRTIEMTTAVVAAFVVSFILLLFATQFAKANRDDSAGAKT